MYLFLTRFFTCRFFVKKRYIKRVHRVLLYAARVVLMGGTSGAFLGAQVLHTGSPWAQNYLGSDRNITEFKLANLC